MSKKQLRYLSLNVSAFGGITKGKKAVIDYPDVTEALKRTEPENGLVIVFPEGYNYVEMEGNQGVGKTSLIECLKEAQGGLAQANTMHQEVNEKGEIVTDKKFGERFWGIDGCLYHLRVTKSTTTLERIEVDEEGNPTLDKKGKEVAYIMKEPKTLLQKVIGPAGISPMELKTKSGPDQVKWMRSLYNLSAEDLKVEYDIKQEAQKVYDERTKFWNDYDRLSKVLAANIYYNQLSKWQTYFDTTKYEDLEKSVADVRKRANEYHVAVAAIPKIQEHRDAINADVNDIELQIKQLQDRLAVKIADRDKADERIAAGNKYLEDNKGVLEEYHSVEPKILEAADYGSHKAGFVYMLQMKNEMDIAFEKKVSLTAQLSELDKQKRDYVKKFSPDIPDFELCVPNADDKREGMYYRKKSLAILAESELWEFAALLYKALNVRIIYVENVSSLGSGAIEKFNEFLATGGCYIFGTKMNRQENNLKISFHTNITV